MTLEPVVLLVPMLLVAELLVVAVLLVIGKVVVTRVLRRAEAGGEGPFVSSSESSGFLPPLFVFSCS